MTTLRRVALIILIPLGMLWPTLALKADSITTQDCQLSYRGQVDGRPFWYYECESPTKKCGLLIRLGLPPQWECNDK
jgi:hypothetical protein